MCSLHSPFYEMLLHRIAEELRAGGTLAKVLVPTVRPTTDLHALRLMGGVHRLVLDGEAPSLAAHYPSTGGTVTPPPAGRRSWSCCVTHPKACSTRSNRRRRPTRWRAGPLGVASRSWPLRAASQSGCSRSAPARIEPAAGELLVRGGWSGLRRARLTRPLRRRVGRGHAALGPVHDRGPPAAAICRRSTPPPRTAA